MGGKMIIAIDGPAGTGKSTIASIIAKRLNITYLNSGSFYRGLTLSMLKSGIDLKFDKNEAPKFNDNARSMKINNKDFTIYYSNECPYVEYEVKELSEYAKEKNIKI